MAPRAERGQRWSREKRDGYEEDEDEEDDCCCFAQNSITQLFVTAFVMFFLAVCGGVAAAALGSQRCCGSAWSNEDHVSLACSAVYRSCYDVSRAALGVGMSAVALLLIGFIMLGIACHCQHQKRQDKKTQRREEQRRYEVRAEHRLRERQMQQSMELASTSVVGAPTQQASSRGLGGPVSPAAPRGAHASPVHHHNVSPRAVPVEQYPPYPVVSPRQPHYNVSPRAAGNVSPHGGYPPAPNQYVVGGYPAPTTTHYEETVYGSGPPPPLYSAGSREHEEHMMRRREESRGGHGVRPPSGGHMAAPHPSTRGQQYYQHPSYSSSQQPAVAAYGPSTGPPPHPGSSYSITRSTSRGRSPSPRGGTTTSYHYSGPAVRTDTRAYNDTPSFGASIVPSADPYMGPGRY
ncbi:unnamed protein product [Amoebophrya sp. A25]|nr:unnamed protein product [Amoebophrya sp. A25]|eukprot:GSA25T00008970001.1